MTKPPLVFIHGFKGCHLIDATTHNKQYLTMTQLANWSNSEEEENISLPISWNEDMKQEKDSLFPENPLEHIVGESYAAKMIGSSLGASVYGIFLDWARKEYGRECIVHGNKNELNQKGIEWIKTCNLFIFTYDWRRENEENVIKFYTFLKELAEIRNYDITKNNLPPQIIAHSLGGLITWATIQKYETEVKEVEEKKEVSICHSVVYAGVPFGASLNFLQDLHIGTSNGGMNMKQVSPSVLFTFPSIYVFFPVYEYTDEERQNIYNTEWSNTKNLLVNEKNGETISIDWSNANEWKTLMISIFAYKNAMEKNPKLQFPNVTNQHIDHLQNCLLKAKQFKEKYFKVTKPFHKDNKLVKGNIPIAVLAGNEIPTRVGAIKGNDISFAIRGIDITNSNLLNDEKNIGDGRVSFVNAKPPSNGQMIQIHVCDRKHEYLLNDTDQVELILAELRDEDLSDYYY